MTPASKIVGAPAFARDRRVRGAASALALVGAVAFLASGVWRCPFAAELGIGCPACGSTRALWSLLRGDLPAVIRFNPVAPFVAFLLGVIGLRIVWLEATRGHTRDLVATPSAWLAVRALPVVLVIELLVWVARFAGLFGGPVPV